MQDEKRRDPTSGTATRQYNDDELKDQKWGLISAMHDYVADEAGALEALADFLEHDNPYLTPRMRKFIKDIMGQEKSHLNGFLQMVYDLEGIGEGESGIMPDGTITYGGRE